MSVPEELVINPPEPAQEYDPATENPERYAIEQIRDKIHMEAADQESLLGTTADAVQLLLYSVAEVAIGLRDATDIAGVNAAAQGLADLLEPFKQRVDAGTVKLPYKLYPIADVITEIETRATKVHEVLAEAAAQQSS